MEFTKQSVFLFSEMSWIKLWRLVLQYPRGCMDECIRMGFSKKGNVRKPLKTLVDRGGIETPTLGFSFCWPLVISVI